MATLTQLTYVVAVDQHRHFGRASKSCHVSQPTLSMQLQKLEDELGISLFDRSKQPIVPTERGKEIIERAKKIIHEVKALEYIGKKDGSTPQGTFKLAVIPTLAPYLVPLFISDFSKKYPKVELFIDEMKTHQIIEALENDQIDGGLLVTPLEQPTIREHVLFYEPFYLYVGQQHPFRKKKWVKESDLEVKDTWLLEDGHCFRNQVLQLCSSKNKERVLQNVHFESGNLETLKKLVQKSKGYTLVPHLSIQSKENPWIKPFSKPVPSREVSMVYRRDQLKLDIIQALIQSIDSNIPKNLPRSKKDLDVIEI